MGVRGLTTFIATRATQYYQSYELHDCYLVIDGNSIACQLYSWHCKRNHCFGGDYDKYAHVVINFYQLLRDCAITPLVVFDGAYENRKLKTVYSRMRNKISAARRLNSVTEGSVAMFPLFVRELFVDITLRLEVKCMRCDFEGDGDAAYLAKTLNCPLLSYDSDFYIFDVLYIPFSTMVLHLRKRKNVKYIACDVYSVDRFLNSFGGLDKVNLPLLAVLLGNDYVKKRTFSHFRTQIKMHKCKGSEQQKIIKATIMWLKNETPESALKTILGRYKLQNRKRIAAKIEMGIKSYQSSNSQICSYFGIETDNKQEKYISVPDPENIEHTNDDDASEDEDLQSSESSEEELTPEQECISKLNLPSYFHKNYTKCLYPPCFMDMMVSRRYYCIPQVENYSLEHSHTISLHILTAIYKILTFPKTQNLTCIARNEHSNVKRSFLPHYEKLLPKLSEIEDMDSKSRRDVLLDILHIASDKLFNTFPSPWHLFLISLKYWVTNSNSKVDMSYIFSLVLCGIVLNYIDNQIGFSRSTNFFLGKHGSNTCASSSNHPGTITESLEDIDLNDSVSCMRKLIHYFQMDTKMRSNIRLFDVNIVHQFAEFQSILLHISTTALFFTT